MQRSLWLLLALSVLGCDETTMPDGGVDAGASDDAAVGDGGPADAAAEDDAGASDAGAVDAGGDDAGVGMDGGGSDGGGSDAGGTDAGGSDAGGSDAAVLDAGAFDAGAFDAGRLDAGAFDAGRLDAGGLDAGRLDAGGSDAGAPDAGAGPLHCRDGHLLLESIDPGVGITVYNPTSATINAAGYWFCQVPRYVQLGATAGAIPPGGRVTLTWPATFANTDAGGEVALYTSAAFASSAAQIDFVCWGTGHGPSSRLSVALADGDWSGGCAGAITGASLRRRPNTDGHGAASYDPTGFAAPLVCP